MERDQERIHERGPVTTIFGEIRVKRFGYGAEGADSLHPLDAELNLPRERYSFELRRTAAVEVSKGAFDEAVASLGRHTGAKVGKRQVEELAGRAARSLTPQELGRLGRRQRHPTEACTSWLASTMSSSPSCSTSSRSVSTCGRRSLGFYEETEPARQVWVQERLLRILRGEACLVAAGIRRSATRRKLTPDNRENEDQCADYLLNHASYLHYDECLAAGFPIATGVIEGACRHLVSDRMDLTGARWSLAGAEAVLRLRALRSSGDFDEYWRFHEQCEYVAQPRLALRRRQGRPRQRPPPQARQVR